MSPAPRASDPVTLFRQDLINKTVPFKFMGQEMTFALSHALFSSFAIDAGSTLLLKTVAQQLDLTRVRTCLDLGSGVGVLGVSLKARFPELEVTAADRDALALEFTSRNARANGVPANEPGAGFCTIGAVGLMGLPPGPYDLVLSNIPAKAGERAIANWIRGLTAFLSDSGVLAFVIVRTLVEEAARALDAAGYEIRHREETRAYTVFHARKTVTYQPDLTLAPYLRQEMTLPAAGGRMKVSTVTGVGEFDTLSFATKIIRKLTLRFGGSGNMLFWNPGQGHLPVTLYREFQNQNISFTLAGRDRLSLETSRHNCLAAGASPEIITIRQVASLFDLMGEFDWLVINPDADAGIPWHVHLFPSLLPLLASGGTAVIAAKSSFLGRVEFPDNVTILKDTRAKGFRGVVLRKSDVRRSA